MIRYLAFACAMVPWWVLAISVLEHLVRRREVKTWHVETAIVGILGLVATAVWADHPVGWMGYGAALFGHGRASIGARVGTAYERLVALPGGDDHAVECIGRARWYAWGAAVIGALVASLVGAWPAVAQLVTSEIYSHWRRARTRRWTPVIPSSGSYPSLLDAELTALLAEHVGDERPYAIPSAAWRERRLLEEVMRSRGIR